MKKVSICIPVYNMDQYIDKAIESALSQTYENIEVIVCDNCSTDNTWKVINNYNYNKKLKIFRNTNNFGAIRNFNRTVELSSGDYIKFLEGDDILEPHCIEEMIHFFNNYNELTIISSGRTLINSEGKIIGEHLCQKEEVIGYQEYINRMRKVGNEVGTPTDVMIKKSTLNRTGLFSTEFGCYLNDWDLWVRCVKEGYVGFIQKKLTFVRRHNQQIGALGRKGNKDVIANFHFVFKNFDNILVRFTLLFHFAEEFQWRSIIVFLKDRTIIHLVNMISLQNIYILKLKIYYILFLPYFILHSPFFLFRFYKRRP